MGRTADKDGRDERLRPAVAGRTRTLLLLSALLPMLVTGCAGSNDTTGAQDDDDPVRTAGIDPDKLVGLDPTQVTGLLGPADFRRDDGPAQILQYRSASCVLDLFLYRADGGGDFRVTYIEARDRSLAKLAPKTCLASVVRGKRSGHFSG